VRCNAGIVVDYLADVIIQIVLFTLTYGDGDESMKDTPSGNWLTLHKVDPQ